MPQCTLAAGTPRSAGQTRGPAAGGRPPAPPGTSRRADPQGIRGWTQHRAALPRVSTCDTGPREGPVSGCTAALPAPGVCGQPAASRLRGAAPAWAPRFPLAPRGARTPPGLRGRPARRLAARGRFCSLPSHAAGPALRHRGCHFKWCFPRSEPRTRPSPALLCPPVAPAVVGGGGGPRACTLGAQPPAFPSAGSAAERTQHGGLLNIKTLHG